MARDSNKTAVVVLTYFWSVSLLSPARPPQGNFLSSLKALKVIVRWRNNNIGHTQIIYFLMEGCGSKYGKPQQTYHCQNHFWFEFGIFKVANLFYHHHGDLL